MLRNGEQLLLAVVIPVIVLIGVVTGAEHLGLSLDHPAVDVFTPGVLALAVLSTSFTSLAIATGFERRYGVLKRLGASPLPRSGLLAGKVGALLLVEVAPARRDLGGRPRCSAGTPTPDAARRSLLAVLLGTAAFASLGLLHGRHAARRGDAGRRQPRLPAAARRRRASSCPPRRTAPSATSSAGCPPARSARRCAPP